MVKHAGDLPQRVRKTRTGSQEPSLPEGIVPTAERVTIHGTANDVIEHGDVDGLRSLTELPRQLDIGSAGTWIARRGGCEKQDEAAAFPRMAALKTSRGLARAEVRVPRDTRCRPKARFHPRQQNDTKAFLNRVGFHSGAEVSRSLRRSIDDGTRQVVFGNVVFQDSFVNAHRFVAGVASVCAYCAVIGYSPVDRGLQQPGHSAVSAEAGHSPTRGKRRREVETRRVQP